MLGKAVLVEDVPFFWSAQHLALYYVGHSSQPEDIVIDGTPGDGPFVAYYVERGQVVAGLAVQRNAELAALHELMRLGRPPSAEAVGAGGFDAVGELRRLASA